LRLNFETLSRAGFWICVVIIIVLSVLPGSLRPHTMASGHVEHFIAYAGTGFLFAPSSGPRARIAAAIGLAALSGALELVQLKIPGRTAEFSGFFASSIGAWLGLLAGAVAWSYWMNHRTRRT
jgi:VanZ family protein